MDSKFCFFGAFQSDKVFSMTCENTNPGYFTYCSSHIHHQEYCCEGKWKQGNDHVVRSEQGEEVNKRIESIDNFVPDQEVEIIFVRRRSKLNERQRANYYD